jgi:hypothetical protein
VGADAFKKHPDEDDYAIFKRLVSQGIERKLACRIVEFLPMAFTRALLRDSGVSFSPEYERGRSPEARVKKRLATEAAWKLCLSFAKSSMKPSDKRDDFLLIAHRSSELQTVNQLLNSGSLIGDISLTPALLLWPEDGPDS